MLDSYRFRNANWNEFMKMYPGIAKIILKWAKEALKREQTFLVLLGDPGTGKSHLAHALFEWYKKFFNTARYWQERDFFNKIRKGIDRGCDYISVLEAQCDDELIVYEDLGKSQLTDWQKEILFNFIDMRYNCCRPTIITTNYKPTIIKKLYGESHGNAITDRLFAKDSTNIDFSGMPNFRQTVEKKLDINF